MVIELTQDEFDRLLVMFGYATGAAMKDNQRLAYSFLELANRINRVNPRWRPYQIPDEFQEHR